MDGRQHRTNASPSVTLLEVLLGTLLFYYKNIKNEIVRTLLLEEYGVSKNWVILQGKKQGEIARSAQVPVGASVASSLDCDDAERFGLNTGGASRRRGPGNGEERGGGRGSGSGEVGGGASSSRGG